MHIPPKYMITPEMLSLISQIDAQRLYFSSLDLSPNLKEKIRRVSLLKSSLFSARIEGNPLKLSDFTYDNSKQDTKREVFNIADAAGFIDKKIGMGKITKAFLLKLHKLVLNNISKDAGYFRTETSAIFNQAGVAIYIPPSPSNIPGLLDNLLTYVNSDKEKFPLVATFITHLVFEKIHPFLDGNGRVGRLFILAILKSKGWDFNFTVPFEEYLDNHKEEYYYHLDRGMQDTNAYLIFMLNAFWEEIQKTKIQIEEELIRTKAPFLPPRQQEIYNIIKDQTIVSFDMIRGRFLNIPERTLRYDLKKLVDNQLIEISGETRGRYYRINPRTVPK